MIPTLGAACLGCAFLCALYAGWAARARPPRATAYTQSGRGPV